MVDIIHMSWLKTDFIMKKKHVNILLFVWVSIAMPLLLFLFASIFYFIWPFQDIHFELLKVELLIFRMLLFIFLCDRYNPADIYLLKVKNKNTKTKCKICSKLTIKILERSKLRRSGVFIANLEHISHLTLCLNC